MREVLKETVYGDGVIRLVKEIRLSYFTPRGRARLAAKAQYHVEVETKPTTDDEFPRTHEASRFNFTNKREATKYYNSVK